jgi:Fibronectin type III domain/Putative Ig domain
MKKKFFLFCLLISIFFLKNVSADTVFSDNFSGVSINADKWIEYDSGGLGGSVGNVRQNNYASIIGNGIWGTNTLKSNITFNRSDILVVQSDFSISTTTGFTNQYAAPLGYGNDITLSTATTTEYYILQVNTGGTFFIISKSLGNTNETKNTGIAIVPEEKYRAIMTVSTTTGATFQLYKQSDGYATDIFAGLGVNKTLSKGSFSGTNVFVSNKTSGITVNLYNFSVSGNFSAPSAPLNLTTTVQNSRVLLSWNVPSSNGGSVISDYRIQYKLSSDSTWLDFAHTASSSTSITVNNLINGSLYDFKVAAINSIGEGGYSNISSATPFINVPSAPLNLIATNNFSNQVDLSWSEPSLSGGSSIFDYLVEYKLSSSQNWSTFSDGVSASTLAHVNGLSNGSSYDFRVLAFNSYGFGDYATTTKFAIEINPVAPVASLVSISGLSRVDSLLTATYSYFDENSDQEGSSIYRWLRSDSVGGQYSVIADATSTNYTLSFDDLNKYIKFEVTPVSVVTPYQGLAVLSNSIGPVTQPDFLYHILSTGQSLSLGYDGAPALSTSQPYSNKMLNGSNVLVPLVENGLETHSSAMANGITNLSGGTYQIAVTRNGVGSTAYAGLKKGTTPYNNGLNQVSLIKSGAISLGKVSRVAAISNIHGETDHSLGNAAYYEGYLNEWQRDYENDIKSITGQSGIIPMFIDQISSFTGAGSANSGIPAAQLAASENNSQKIIMVGPKYYYNYATVYHLNNLSYRWLGEYHAKVIKKVVFDRETWKPLSPEVIERNENVIYAKFHVPVGNIVFDNVLVMPKTNYGFEYFDDGSSSSISSVEIINSNTVKVTLSSAPTGNNQRLRYAYSGTPTSKPGAQIEGSARGNLRDTDPAVSLSGNTLYDWSVQFDKSIAVNNNIPSNLVYQNNNVYIRSLAINSLQPTITNIPTSYSITPALPSGLNFATSTGIISGTPTVTLATTTYTVTATNSGGSTSFDLTMKINDATPTNLSYTNSNTFIKDSAISSLTPTVTGLNLIYSITPALPSGLNFATSTGIISGTPTVTLATTTYTVTATNSGGSTSFDLTMKINDATPTNLSYTNSNTFIKDSAISSLTPTVTGLNLIYSITPALPSGLNFATSTGIISGTPTVTLATTTYTVTATNSGGSTSFDLTMKINDNIQNNNEVMLNSITYNQIGGGVITHVKTYAQVSVLVTFNQGVTDYPKITIVAPGNYADVSNANMTKISPSTWSYTWTVINDISVEGLANISISGNSLNGSSFNFSNASSIEIDSYSPSVSSFTTNYISSSSAILSVVTNENATCKFSNTEKSYEEMNLMSNTSTTTHSNLLTNLNPDTPYNYYIRCSDKYGSVMMWSAHVYFKTLSVSGVASLSADSPVRIILSNDGTANNYYENGWEWKMRITLPSNQNNLALKFNDWSFGDKIISTAGNMKYYSEQIINGLGSIGEPVLISSNSYLDNILIPTDADLSRDGIQTDIRIKVKIPNNTLPGSYSTSYGIRSQ